MTGWRIGYAAGPKDIITAMGNLQSQSTSNPTSISQAAAEAALNSDQSCIKPMVTTFKERHSFIVKAFNDIKGLECIDAQGAFYSFPCATEAADLILHAMAKTIQKRTVTYDLERLIDGATLLSCSEFGEALKDSIK